MSDSSQEPAPEQAKQARLPMNPRRSVHIAALMSKTVAPVLMKRGFASTDIIAGWPEIVGVAVARHTRPLALSWPPRPLEQTATSTSNARRGATLQVACAGAFALELQHLAPVVIERINQRFGWRCVEKIVIRQQPIMPDLPVAKPLPPDAQMMSQARSMAENIRSDALREAMVRFGANILAKTARNR